MALIGIARDRRAAALAGIFVAAGIALIVGWVLLRIGEIASGQTFYAVFPNVSGLNTGAEIQVAGYTVGSVRAIEPIVERGSVRFRLQLLVRSDWLLPVGTTAKMASPGLLAAPVIALDLGDTEGYLDPGITLPTTVDPSLEQRLDGIIAQVEGIVRGVAVAVDEDLPAIFESLVSTAAEIDEVVARDFDPMMRDLRTATETLDRSTLELEQDLDQVLSSLDNTTQMLEGLVGSIDPDKLEAAVNGTETTVALANQALARFDVVAADISRLIGTLGPDLSVVASDAAYVLQQLSSSLNLTLLNLERASQELADLIADIRANPSIFLTGRESD